MIQLLLNNLSFPHSFETFRLSYTEYPYILVLVSECSILFHWYIFKWVLKYCTILIEITLYNFWYLMGYVCSCSQFMSFKIFCVAIRSYLLFLYLISIYSYFSSILSTISEMSKLTSSIKIVVLLIFLCKLISNLQHISNLFFQMYNVSWQVWLLSGY